MCKSSEKSSNEDEQYKKSGGTDMNAVTMPTTSSEYIKLVELINIKKNKKKECCDNEIDIYRKTFLELTDEEMDLMQQLMDADD